MVINDLIKYNDKTIICTIEKQNKLLRSNYYRVLKHFRMILRLKQIWMILNCIDSKLFKKESIFYFIYSLYINKSRY